MDEPFGNCCKDLADCIHELPNSMFRVEESGVLYLTVGYTTTQEGTGWFDHAVFFCPFCGKRLQDPKLVEARAFEKVQ